jgi:hypothetical protein
MSYVKAFTNKSSVKVVLLIWDILEPMAFFHHDVRSLPKRPNKNNMKKV